MNIENYIESQYRALVNDLNIEYIDQYSSFSNQKLKEIFSTIHHMCVINYKRMNDRLPTNDYRAHFWAEPSRDLIRAIESLRGLQRALKQTQYAFELDAYYENVITNSEKFLSSSGGSELPPNMEKVDIYYTIPILTLSNSINITTTQETHYANLKLIGEGSYANVFSFNDPFYNRKYVLKRAKKDLNAKELERFKQEFEEMNKLSSPYVVEVYRYEDDNNQYVMELMDYSLDKYYEKYNASLSKEDRRSIANQILRAFKYIHSKGLLHRDISPKNILVKIYDDVKVIKVSDFGLIKVPDSNLTSVNTEFKGYFNDPKLVTEGFYTYDKLHETYAITRLIYFVMTGKTNVSNIKESTLKDFIDKGLSVKNSDRFQDIDEIMNALRKL